MFIILLYGMRWLRWAVGQHPTVSPVLFFPHLSFISTLLHSSFCLHSLHPLFSPPNPTPTPTFSVSISACVLCVLPSTPLFTVPHPLESLLSCVCVSLHGLRAASLIGSQHRKCHKITKLMLAGGNKQAFPLLDLRTNANLKVQTLNYFPQALFIFF